MTREPMKVQMMIWTVDTFHIVLNQPFFFLLYKHKRNSIKRNNKVFWWPGESHPCFSQIKLILKCFKWWLYSRMRKLPSYIDNIFFISLNTIFCGYPYLSRWFIYLFGSIFIYFCLPALNIWEILLKKSICSLTGFEPVSLLAGESVVRSDIL